MFNRLSHEGSAFHWEGGGRETKFAFSKVQKIAFISPCEVSVALQFQITPLSIHMITNIFSSLYWGKLICCPFLSVLEDFNQCRRK